MSVVSYLRQELTHLFLWLRVLHVWSLLRHQFKTCLIAIIAVAISDLASNQLNFEKTESSEPNRPFSFSKGDNGSYLKTYNREKHVRKISLY